MTINRTDSFSPSNLTVQSALCELSSIKKQFVIKLYNVKNTTLRMANDIKKMNVAIAGECSMLQELQNISNEKGKDALVRMKNGHFRFGEGDNFLKRKLYSSRYKTERAAAAHYLGSQGNDVSAAKGIARVEGIIKNKNSQLDLLTDGLHKQTVEYRNINDTLSVLNDKLRHFSDIENKAKEEAENKTLLRKDFSLLYHSNAGCKAINAEARNQFSHTTLPVKLRSGDVIAEYLRVHGDNIFAKGNADLKYTIEARCSHLAEFVKSAAHAWYMPANTNSTTYRGQGMTKDGADRLIRQFSDDRANHTRTVYEMGQFFSTSRSESVAFDFASKSSDAVKIIFEIEGNSGRGLEVPGGLTFVNKEREILYSPLAKFNVVSVKEDPAGMYRIRLTEVGQNEKSRLLPY